MKINLTLHYQTRWGQTVFACFSESERRDVEFVCLQAGVWSATVEDISGTYFYQIRENGQIVSQEPNGSHSFPRFETGNSEIFVTDFWKETLPSSFWKTSGFQHSFFCQDFTPDSIYINRSVLTFRIESLFLPPSVQLALVGETEFLGHWKAENALRFVPVAYGEWVLCIEKNLLFSGIEYKLLLQDKDSGEILQWQSGDNRHLFFDPEDKIQILHLAADEFQKPFKASGVAIPVFSLRSVENYGVGEFPSLKKMVDWATLTGQKIIQILPINDTTSNYTWRDSYPYNAISIYALHPIYLGLSDLSLKDKSKNLAYRKMGDELNRLPAVDYEKVIALKKAYMDDLFEEISESVLKESDFLEFIKRNEEWLFPYACFCCLREENKSSNFREWARFSHFEYAELKTWSESSSIVKEKIDKIYFTQYLLNKQLAEVKEYAHSKGVILKGDIPIGVNPCGVDAWADANFFNMETQTGAPPDDFAILGQNWGFPTYNWGEMAKDGYGWWKKRFSKMADYFDAYRIDHILGFFRIWEIPRSSIHGLLGHFSPALPYSMDEIASSGFLFDERGMTTASMLEADVCELFGSRFDEACEKYIYAENGIFRLQYGFETQRQIEDYFSDRLSEEEQELKEKLFLFCDEVLFIRDRHQPNKFHPRITAYTSKRFLSLFKAQQDAFYRLYEDFYFYRHNEFWKTESLKKLPTLLRSTGMLACGEDLGMIPACVPEVMKELEILSLEIERMPKTYGVAFEPLNSLPYLSVCTTSTHDLSPIRLWWKEDKNLTQRYYNEVLWKNGEAPDECSIELCRQILINHLQSPAMLVILPLQDWLSVDSDWRQRPEREERINVPADANHYWRYRMQETLEDLLAKQSVNQQISFFLSTSGRL